MKASKEPNLTLQRTYLSIIKINFCRIDIMIGACIDLITCHAKVSYYVGVCEQDKICMLSIPATF